MEKAGNIHSLFGLSLIRYIETSVEELKFPGIVIILKCKSNKFYLLPNKGYVPISDIGAG